MELVGGGRPENAGVFDLSRARCIFIFWRAVFRLGSRDDLKFVCFPVERSILWNGTSPTKITNTAKDAHTIYDQINTMFYGRGISDLLL